MTLNHKAASRLLPVCALAIFSLTAVAQAQPSDRGRGDRDGRGTMMGPGMMDRGHFRAHVQPSRGGFFRMATGSAGKGNQADRGAAREVR